MNSTALNDNYARVLEAEWKKHFPDASILPVIGYPSYKNSGVVTITHTMGNNQLMKINGLASRSPLANNALFSSEISNGKYLNLYEIMIPDIPGVNGAPSTVDRYLSALAHAGMNIAGVHYHWNGGTVAPNDKGVIAIHHQAIGMGPIDFINNTAVAIKSVGL
jgi:hypothetical protein